MRSRKVRGGGFVNYDPDKGRGDLRMDPIDPRPDLTPYGPQAPKTQAQAVNFRPADTRFYICDRCGGREYWQPYQGGRAFCVRCRPQPKPAPIAAPALQLATMAAQPAAPAAVPTATQPTATTRAQRSPSRQPQPAREYPAVIDVFTVLTLSASRTKGAGAGYRLYLLAKALDQAGQGRVKREDLRAYAYHLGIDPRTYRHALEEARGLDLLQDIQAAPEKGGEWFYILAGYARAARAIYLQALENDQERTAQGKRAKGANVPSIGGRKVQIPAADLFRDGWRALVWAGYEKTHEEKSISRERKQQLTAIPPSTQTRRNKQAGVRKVRNLARSAETFHGRTNSSDPDRLRGLRENTNRPGLHVRRDGALAWFVPSHAIVKNESVRAAARGSARKYSKQLRGLLRLEGLPLVRRALTSFNSEPDASQGADVWRLFNYTDRQFKATRKKIRDLKPGGGDLYACPKRSAHGRIVWEHAHAADYLPGGGLRP